MTAGYRRKRSLNKFRIVSIALFLVGLAFMSNYVIKEKGGTNRQAPELTIEGDLIEVSVKDEEQALLKGVTAYDAEDGDLTDSVIVDYLGQFTEDNHRVISYAVVDSDNHVTHGQRELVYSDYTPAQFTVESPLKFEMGTINLTNGITVTDCLDGDLTSSIRLHSEKSIDVNKPGTYSAEVRVTNSAGATSSMPVTIEIVNSTQQ